MSLIGNVGSTVGGTGILKNAGGLANKLSGLSSAYTKTRNLINTVSAIRGGENGEGQNGWNLVDESGQTVLQITSVLSCSVTYDGQVVSEPVEEGSFTTYNKTSAPIQVSCEWAFSGLASDLQGILENLLLLKENTDVFSIVTPFAEFRNMTLERYDWKMDASSGDGLLTVNAICVEVRESKAEYSTVSQEAIQANQNITASSATDASDVSSVDVGQASVTDASAEETADGTSRRKTLLRSLKDAVLGG